MDDPRPEGRGERMLGAIIGDIVGSRFEWDNIKKKDFALFTGACFATDDSIMTVAVAKAILESEGNPDRLGPLAVQWMQTVGRPYPNCGYGGRFYGWMYSDEPQPYNSYGNGAAMRVSPCGFAAASLDEALDLARRVTEVTHNHPEGLKGAAATTAAIWLAKSGEGIPAIRDHIEAVYYPLDFKLDEIRPGYRFNESCQGTVPQAIAAFLESVSFEDAIRNAISLGGDSDTLAAITGGIAQAYYGIPDQIRARAITYLDANLLGILNDFEGKYPPPGGKTASGI